MKNTIYILLLFTPVFINSQSSLGISYQEGLENCQRIVDENKKLNPDKFIYTGPDCLIGASVPEFSGLTIEGKQISPEYFKGKITILNLWMISCPPCIIEIPEFNNIMYKFGHDKLNYLAISPDDEKDITAFLIKHPWGFSQLSSMMISIDIFKARWGFPTTFVIDENGLIIAAFSGGLTDDKLSGIIAEVLK